MKTNDDELYFIVRIGTSDRVHDTFYDPLVVTKSVLEYEVNQTNGVTSSGIRVGISIKEFKEKFGDHVHLRTPVYGNWKTIPSKAKEPIANEEKE